MGRYILRRILQAIPLMLLISIILFILTQNHDDWQLRHYTSRYRAIRRETLTQVLGAAGFTAVEWLMPDTSDYYQPIVIAHRG